MTVNEAAARLDVAPVSVRNAIARGKLAATKRGRDWWIEEADVDRYAKEHRYTTTRKEAEA